MIVIQKEKKNFSNKELTGGNGERDVSFGTIGSVLRKERNRHMGEEYITGGSQQINKAPKEWR